MIRLMLSSTDLSPLAVAGKAVEVRPNGYAMPGMLAYYPIHRLSAAQNRWHVLVTGNGPPGGGVVSSPAIRTSTAEDVARCIARANATAADIELFRVRLNGSASNAPRMTPGVTTLTRLEISDENNPVPPTFGHGTPVPTTREPIPNAAPVQYDCIAVSICDANSSLEIPENRKALLNPDGFDESRLSPLASTA